MIPGMVRLPWKTSKPANSIVGSVPGSPITPELSVSRATPARPRSATRCVANDTRPGYDPYGWLDWGYQTLRGSLDLGGAPSWKPYTYLFNVPYAIFGHWALYLWMLTAVSVSLGGAVFGGRVAYRLTDADP